MYSAATEEAALGGGEEKNPLIFLYCSFYENEDWFYLSKIIRREKNCRICGHVKKNIVS